MPPDVVLDMRHKEECFLNWGLHPGEAPELTRVAHEVWGDRFRFGHRRNRVYFLAWVAAGHGWEEGATEERQRLQRGDLFLHGPGRPRAVGVDPGRTLELYIAVAPDASALGALATECFGDRRGRLHTADPGVASRLWTQILQEARSGRRSAPAVCRRLLEALLLRATDEWGAGGAAAGQAERTFRRCRQYMRQSFAKVRTASDVAAACSVHPVHLSRLFRRFAGHGPLEHLNRIRMDAAAHLLVATPLTVKEIAREVGCADPYTFSRAFKRIHGRAPLHYREEALATREA